MNEQPQPAPKVDPAPDVYSVTRAPGAVFVVRHFRTATARQPCCVVTVTREAGESDIDALARANQLCDQRHAKGAHRA